MSKVIAVDCDITIARSDDAWWNWMERVCSEADNNDDFKPSESTSQLKYDLTYYFRGSLGGRDGLDFWRGEYVYYYVDPIFGAVEQLKILHEAGYEIIVVSATKGNHTKSKWQFLQRHFPFVKGFISTKEKQYIKCDYFVDDRSDILNKVSDDVIKIRIDSPYKQSEELITGVEIVTWEEIKDYILENDNAG